MKALTFHEFFRSPDMVKSLHPGQTLIVTSNGKPDLIVTKAGGRPRKKASQLQREAKALLSKPGKKVDTVALIKKLWG